MTIRQLVISVVAPAVTTVTLFGQRAQTPTAPSVDLPILGLAGLCSIRTGRERS